MTDDQREDEAYPVIARSLFQNRKEDCEYWLSRLEPYKRGLTAEECFMLWSALGFLRFHPWALDLPRKEVLKVKQVARGFQQRLSRALTRWKTGAKRSILEIRLEKGIDGIVEETEVGLQAARRSLESGALGTNIVSDEFNHDVLRRMDEVGYILELMREMGSVLSRSTLDKVERLDRDLREFLPKAEKQFAENKDPIYIVRPMFPESFWWRLQILHPETG